MVLDQMGNQKCLKYLKKYLCGQYAQCDKSIFIKMKKSNVGATPEIMDLMGRRVGVFLKVKLLIILK
jgi:hypothetical protein